MLLCVATAVNSPTGDTKSEKSEIQMSRKLHLLIQRLEVT